MTTSPLIKQLLEAGVHFGHQTKRWHPKMRRFIFGSHAGIYIIDLEKTEQQIQAACDFVEEVAAKRKQVLFVGTKKQARPILESEAKRAEMPYVINRWLGGTMTNFHTVKRNITLLRDLRTKKQGGFLDSLSKKEARRIERQLEQLEGHFGGLADMDELPGCLFVVDTKREEIAVREANRLNIPIVAICDTNVDPDELTYPIPGNDDAIRSIQLIAAIISERVIAGKRRAMDVQPLEADTEEPAAADEEKEEQPAENKTDQPANVEEPKQ